MSGAVKQKTQDQAGQNAKRRRTASTSEDESATAIGDQEHARAEAAKIMRPRTDAVADYTRTVLRWPRALPALTMPMYDNAEHPAVCRVATLVHGFARHQEYDAQGQGYFQENVEEQGPLQDIPVEKVVLLLSAGWEGCGKLFALLVEGRLLVEVGQQRTWHYWNGKHWTQQAGSGIALQLVDLMRGRLNNLIIGLTRVATDTDPDATAHQIIQAAYDVRLLTRWAVKMGNAYEHVLEKVWRYLQAKPIAWNSAVGLLPFANGTLEMATATLRLQQPTDYFTYTSSTEWRGIDAAAPRFEQALRAMLTLPDAPPREGESEEEAARRQAKHADDATTVAWMQVALGCTLSGSKVGDFVIMLHGAHGSNGKTTLMEILKLVFGAFVTALTADVVLESRDAGAGAATPHLLRLEGARLGWVDEANGVTGHQTKAINESLIKALSGAKSEVQVRPLFKEIKDIPVLYTIWLCINTLPEMNGNSSSLFRRIRVVPMPCEFVTVVDDRALKAHQRPTMSMQGIKSMVADEASGIAAWVVRGYQAYLQNNDALELPPVLARYKEEVRQSCDTFSAWLGDCCQLGPEHSASLEQLMRSYCGFAQLRTANRPQFTSMLQAAGAVSTRQHGRAMRLWKGIGLAPSQNE
jgi:phage/plasmid-associated DNA primase